MVIWKGINFREKGIIVEKTPSLSKPQKRIETYEISGRNGFLSVDTGTYNSFVVTIECHFDESTYNSDDICAFLDGYGTLSFDGKREYTAIIQNAIKFERIKNFKSFPVQFLVNPIAEDIESTTYDVLSNPDTLSIPCATAKMYPVLEITGSGDVSISFNSHTFYLKSIDGKYILDCKEKVITHNNVNASNLMLNDFPYLENGDNIISYIGTISEFKITYKKAYV